MICLSFGLALGADAKFEASLDRDRIALGETAQLGLTFYGVQSMPALDVGSIDGLEVRYIGPSTMMTVINGRMASSVTHRYSVLPLKTGRFQLGPFAFTYKGTNYTSNMINLEVAEEKAVKEPVKEEPITEKMNLEDRLFVTLQAVKTTAYVNELIPVTVKLYVNRLNVSDIQLPAFSQEGFSKVEFKEPKQYKEEMNGLVYDVLEFSTNIFGTRPGDYRLGPAKIKANLVVRKSVPRSSAMQDDFLGDDHFRDSFFEDFYTRYEKHPIELKSQDMQLLISPLPQEGQPKDFSGAVGDYQFIFDVNPRKVKAGDPVTLRMDIHGTGNFNTVLPPKLDNTDGFKVYETQAKTEERGKTFTQVMIPESEKITQIPKITFNYFDPVKKEYKNISHGPIPLSVEKGNEEAPSQVVASPVSQVKPSPQTEELARDIIYIKEAPGRWRVQNRRIYRNRVFYALVGLPPILLLLLYIIQGRKNRMRRDARYAGRVTALRIARTGVKGLRHKLGSDPAVFYENIFQILQDYLGNRFNIPTAGITYDAVAGLLASRNVDRDILRKLQNLFDTCDKARYGFSQIDQHKMKDDLKELEEAMKYFERNKG